MKADRNSQYKVVGLSLAAMSLGLALAWIGVATGLALGWVGAFVLVAWAFLARRRWEALYERDGSDPGPPEQIAWQRLLGYSAIFGHMIFSFVNPHIDIHVGSGNFLAFDNWTLVLGMVASSLVFRANSQERDERDDRIAAFATLWAYRTLIGLLIIFLLTIGFLPSDLRSIFHHFVLANLLVGTILVSLIVGQTCQLCLYAHDRLVVA